MGLFAKAVYLFGLGFDFEAMGVTEFLDAFFLAYIQKRCGVVAISFVSIRYRGQTRTDQLVV